MTARKLFALAGAMVVVLSVLGPGVAAAASSGNQDAGNLSVDVTQDDDDVTVKVTYNGSAASGANVTVSDGSYAGTGEHVADDDGEVDLPAPENNTTITVTASYEGETASTTADLTAGDDGDGNASDAFGQQVSAFVHELLENGTDDNESVGQAVSEFVTENNPGQGPPDHAGPPDDGEQGPPEEKGNNGNGNGSDKPENADGNGNDNGGGPPDHAKNDDGDDGDEEESDS